MSELLLQEHLILDQSALDNLETMIYKRVHNHQPLQYILGTVPFCGLNINVKPPILIPRPETEEWVTWLITLCQNENTLTILDLCTGTGCIGLALAKHLPKTTVIGIDINPAAIALANENKNANNLTNISFMTSDLYANLPELFTCNLIVSNPPYLSIEEYDQLDASVRTWEDKNALVGDNAGMIFYHKILRQASQFLHKSLVKPTLPSMILEIGPAQEPQLINKLFTQNNITKYTIHKDLQGKQRWISLTLPL